MNAAHHVFDDATLDQVSVGNPLHVLIGDGVQSIITACSYPLLEEAAAAGAFPIPLREKSVTRPGKPNLVVIRTNTFVALDRLLNA